MLGAKRGRSEEDRLHLDQKLLYNLLDPQHWVSIAGGAMVQSYGADKMW